MIYYWLGRYKLKSPAIDAHVLIHRTDGRHPWHGFVVPPHQVYKSRKWLPIGQALQRSWTKVREGPQMTRRRLMTRRTVKWTVLSSSLTGDSPAVVFPLKGWPPSSPSFLYRLMRYSSLGTSLETRALWGRTAVGRLKFHRHRSETHEIPLSLVPWMAIITTYTLTKIFTFKLSACVN